MFCYFNKEVSLRLSRHKVIQFLTSACKYPNWLVEWNPRHRKLEQFCSICLIQDSQEVFMFHSTYFSDRYSIHTFLNRSDKLTIQIILRTINIRFKNYLRTILNYWKKYDAKKLIKIKRFDKFEKKKTAKKNWFLPSCRFPGDSFIMSN